MVAGGFPSECSGARRVGSAGRNLCCEVHQLPFSVFRDRRFTDLADKQTFSSPMRKRCQNRWVFGEAVWDAGGPPTPSGERSRARRHAAFPEKKSKGALVPIGLLPHSFPGDSCNADGLFDEN